MNPSTTTSPHPDPHQYSQSTTKSRTPFKLNALNLLHNDSWGPELSKTKPDDTFQIHFQNINGLRLGNNGLYILDYFCHMRTIGANILGASEINVEASHPFVQRLVNTHQNQVWDHSRFQLSNSNISFNSTRKPGGTLIRLTGNAAG
jgi:hypothetical protein